MTDFDFFGTEDQTGNKAAGQASGLTADPAADQDGSPELEISFEYDYEHILADGKDKSVKLCATVKPSDALRRAFERSGGNRGAHICLVIDTSQSMYFVLPNTGAVRTGKHGVDEHGRVIEYARGGLSRINIAIESAKKVVDLMRPGDTLSCITYDNDARVIFRDLTIADRDKIVKSIGSIATKGLSTNISAALTLADKELSAYDDSKPKRVLFFTDGEPTGEDTEERGISVGKTLASHNIAVESMGFGSDEVNFPYLQKISAESGGVTNLINYPDEFASVFTSLFAQSQSVVVTNARLVLRLVPGTKVYDYYRGTPDNVYLGNREGSDERTFEINLGQIEKNQMYKYYFNVVLQGVDDYEGQLNTMSAELRYFVPGRHNDEEQVVKVNVPVTYTFDEDEASEINGNVNVLFRLAEVKRFDEEREKAFKAGDTEGTVKWIRRIISVCTELQKPDEAKAYTEMLNQYMSTNKISKAVLNKAVSSSSQAQETGLLGDLEDDETSEFANRLKQRRRH